VACGTEEVIESSSTDGGLAVAFLGWGSGVHLPPVGAFGALAATAVAAAAAVQAQYHQPLKQRQQVLCRKFVSDAFGLVLELTG
jgi:hypothetical protein